MLFPSCALLALLAALLAAGCGSNEEALNPALRLSDKDFASAVERGRQLVCSGSDPYQAYKDTKEANVRVTPEVAVRTVSCGWPADEVAFSIARAGDKSDQGVERAANEARQRTAKEIKFSVIVQLPKSRDRNSLQFFLQASNGQRYPSALVEPPVWIRDVSSALDPSMPASVLVGYDIHFPVQGSPGYPPIGPEVNSLDLVVKDGDSEASVNFPMKTSPTPAY